MIIKNIEGKVRLATFIAGGSLVASLLISAIVSFFAYRQVASARQSIYIMDSGNVPMRASQTDVQMNRAAEYRSHIGRFHSLFFSLTPDDKFIEYQMKQAMYLIDESGALQYNNLKEKGFFNSILSSSAVLTIRTDSIVLDLPTRYFRFYGTQKIDRRSSTITRSLVTEGYLSDLEIRSENNPHAVLITKWKTLENKDLQNVQKIRSNPLEGRLWQALKTKLSLLLTRYPAYLFAGMLLCMVISAIWVFSGRKMDKNIAVFKSRSSLIVLDTLGAKLPSIAETYGALNRVLALQSEIGALIEKNSLSSSDSTALIEALEEFESLQRSMQPKNKLP